jgi:ABC-2 type transport system ATP-binding protein
MRSDDFTKLELPGFRHVDSHTLEFDLGRDHDVNEVFALLNKADIHVKGMRNKSNRLEQLFLSRLKNSTV